MTTNITPIPIIAKMNIGSRGEGGVGVVVVSEGLVVVVVGSVSVVLVVVVKEVDGPS